MKKNIKDEITPESLYLKRRNFLKYSIYSGSALTTTMIYKFFRKPISKEDDGTALAYSQDVTSYKNITGYNNFYEFSTDKESVASESKKWDITQWNLNVEGLVENKFSLNLNQINEIQMEERIYRFRCVEGWSMVIPWLGFSLGRIIDQAKPLSSAKFIAFESYYDEKEMPNAKWAGISFPYKEGLRLDEALNRLTFLATGLYGKKIPNQNGAPIRLVVPWKYGFKSIKSISKIIFTDQMPQTTWNNANPDEYGFYSNVNPNVDHPRWSQKNERKIGFFKSQPTLMFNGYEKDVEALYAGMDLRVHF